MKNLKAIQLICIVLLIVAFAPQTWAQGRRRQENSRRPREKEQKKEQSLNNLPAAFVPNWQFVSEKTSRLPVLAEKDAVYLPLLDGRVISLDSKNGDFRWETQPGGVIVSPLIATNENIFIAIKPGSTENKQNGGLLRSINKRSGLTLWTKELPQTFTTPLLLQDDRIYCAAEDQNLYVLEAHTGNQLWSTNLGAISRGKIYIEGEDLFIGTEGGTLHVMSRSDGKERWQFQAKSAIRGTVTADETYLYFGDSDGYLYCLERATGKQRWRWRTGAAIETAPYLLGKLVLVASFDNFVYALDRIHGDRIWKVRLTGRLSFDPVLSGENIIFTPLGESQLFVLSEKGRVLGNFRVNKGEILAPPVFSEERLFLVTEEGLIAAQSQKIEKPVKDKDDKPRKNQE